MLTADIIRPDALHPSEVQSWTAMRQAHPAFSNPLLGPRWASVVGRVRDDARVAVFRRNGQTLGFLAHHRGFNGGVRPIGAPFSDLHALIAAPGSQLTLPEALGAAGLRSFRFSGLLDLEGRAQGTGEPVLSHLVELRPGQDVSEMIRARNPKRIKNNRRLGHKLEREHGPTELAAHDASPDAFRTLMNWKRVQLRSSGLHDVYRPNWVQRLMLGLMQAPDPAFGGLLVTLYAGGRPVAGEFGVREGGCFHPWIAAYDPAFAAYSPGILLQLRLIERMQALQLTRYDLGTSSDTYKAALTTDQMTVWAGLAHAAGEGLPARGPWSAALDRSRVGVKVRQRWEQIAAVETTVLGRLQGVALAVRDGPRRLSRTASDGPAAPSVPLAGGEHPG